jgi:predicted GTPase
LYGLRAEAIKQSALPFVAKVAGIVTASSLLKLIPFLGSAINAAVAGTFTGAMGLYVKNNFEASAIAKIEGRPLPELGFNIEHFQQFYTEYKKKQRRNNSMKANSIICGKTGVGKTSLIEAMTHAGTVPDEAIGHAQATTIDFDVYETEAVNFIDCQGMEPGQTVDEYAEMLMGEVVKRLDSDQAENLVHNIWYCIDGSGARLQSADARLITRFSDKVLLVITKAELLRKNQIEPLMEEVLLLLPAERIVMVSSLQKSGLQQLLDKAPGDD